jgi:TetR/AcrR family transcriptional regulator, tetracycline repressor protein
VGKLNRDAIVAGAIAQADSEGLDTVTIRRLAQDYGVTPMALYWHFKDKDQLLDGIAARLFADVHLPAASDAPWHTQLRAVLDAFLAAMRPHPSVAELTLTRIYMSGPGLAVADKVLGLLRSGGFSAEEAAQYGSYLLCAIATLITAEPGRAVDTEEQHAMLSALSPEKYPHVVASAAELASCADADVYYARGLDLLVQGVKGLR